MRMRIRRRKAAASSCTLLRYVPVFMEDPIFKDYFPNLDVAVFCKSFCSNLGRPISYAYLFPPPHISIRFCISFSLAAVYGGRFYNLLTYFFVWFRFMSYICTYGFRKFYISDRLCLQRFCAGPREMLPILRLNVRLRMIFLLSVVISFAFASVCGITIENSYPPTLRLFIVPRCFFESFGCFYQQICSRKAKGCHRQFKSVETEDTGYRTGSLRIRRDLLFKKACFC